MTTKSYLIVVGVDGSDGGRRALQWAVHEAHRRGGVVQAVTAWTWQTNEPPGSSGTADEARDRALAMLAEEVEGLPAYQRSGVPIATEAVEGRPADVLTAAADGADLLVLGSHGHSQAWHMVLGSVSQECIRKATCPVVLLPVKYEQS
jgi:nucleotide-binding universal stress UspA family protein